MEWEVDRLIDRQMFFNFDDVFCYGVVWLHIGNDRLKHFDKGYFFVNKDVKGMDISRVCIYFCLFFCVFEINQSLSLSILGAIFGHLLVDKKS